MNLNKKISSNNEEHKKIMFLIIKDLFSSDIKSQITFKWGTLCMFLYQLDRFSVDLDFDIIKPNVSLEKIKKTTKDILNQYWNIIEETKTKLLLKYDQKQIPLKIEFNTRIYKSNTYEVKNFFGNSIIAMTPDCIFANKLVALTERKEQQNKIASRDLYDIRFFFNNRWNINEAIIKERTGKSLKTYLHSLLSFIPDNFNEENILRWIGELITEKQKYFIKNKLIQETLNHIEFKISNLS